MPPTKWARAPLWCPFLFVVRDVKSSPLVRQPNFQWTFGWTPLRACVKGGPSTQFNIAATDGRTAEAMRDRHIPAATTTNAQLLQLFLFD